jgi:hypothetical protein
LERRALLGSKQQFFPQLAGQCPAFRFCRIAGKQKFAPPVSCADRMVMAGGNFGGVLIWSAATCRRFPTGRHVAQFQSADVSAHSKSSHSGNFMAQLPPWRLKPLPGLEAKFLPSRRAAAAR